MNAFLPAQEADSPQQFSGRTAEVKQLADALQTHGSCPLVYGDRGLGKSSLALQLRLIAMGDTRLLHSIGAGRWALAENDQYLTFYVTCTDATKNLDGLLQLMINAAESIEFTSVAHQKSATQLVDKTTRKKLAFKVFEYERTKSYKNAKEREDYRDLSLAERLQQVARILSDSYDMRVLFIVDEIDRLVRKTGLASFLKAASSSYLKFMLVGIASNIADLLTDHRSLERSVVPVRVPLMTLAELLQIIDKTEAALEGDGHNFHFEEGAKRTLASTASGFPWFIHVLGQAALVAADNENRETITLADVTQAKLGIVESRFAQQFADTYQNAVRDSYQREMVLRAFAEWTDTDIPTSDVYRALKQKLKVTNPSIYKKNLVANEFGGILISPAFQSRGLVRFTDEIFKAYVRMRRSIYRDAAERVREATREAWR